jgi:hypothetical protein
VPDPIDAVADNPAAEPEATPWRES